MVHHTHLGALERKTADSSRREEDGGRVGGRDKAEVLIVEHFGQE